MKDSPANAVLDAAENTGGAWMASECRDLINALPDGILIVDRTGLVEASNTAAEELFGRSAADIAGHELMDLFRSAGERVQDKVRKMLASGRAGQSTDALILGKCGTAAQIMLSMNLVPDSPNKFLVVARDVTLRHRAAEQLTQAQQELQLTFHHAPIGMATISLSGSIITINQALCSMLGYEEAELIDSELAAITHSDDTISARRLKHLLLEDESAYIREDKRYLKKDGSVVFGVVRFSLVRDLAQEPLLIVAQIVDRTDQKKAEREIRQHRERLVEVSRLGTMGEMAAGIAHELNQPLTAIGNYAQACQRLVRDNAISADELNDIMGKVKVQARRASQVISGLRSFVKKRSVTRRPTDIHRLLSEVAMLAELDTNANGIPMTMDVADILPQVQADPVQLQQVLLNLIRNAIDAMTETPRRDDRIHVTARANGDDLLISVEDHGRGIPDDVSAKLFDPFFTTKKKGLGIGLSFSKSIIEDHGGSLTFEPSPSGGTVFWIQLPTLLERES
ncbi:MAG: PAS domain S-box protein [Gammaproteobacteria bacterium]